MKKSGKRIGNMQHHTAKARQEEVDAFLAQALFSSIDEPTTPCQGEVHQRAGQQPVRASWATHFYEDFELAQRLLRQGMQPEQVQEAIWNTACEEQDTIGIVTHSTRKVCDLCAAHLAAQHAGKEPALHVVIDTLMSEKAFLLVCDRRTRMPAIVGALPAGIQEDELLQWLKQTKEMSVLRFESGN